MKNKKGEKERRGMPGQLEPGVLWVFIGSDQRAHASTDMQAVLCGCDSPDIRLANGVLTKCKKCKVLAVGK